MPAKLFIDPGTRKLGMAKFADDGSRAWLIKSRVEVVKGKIPWTDRCDTMVQAVVRSLQPKRSGRGKIDRWPVEEVWIELPRHFAGETARGEGAKNSGAILKLMFLIGALRLALLERGYPVELVRVEKWKGNVPKQVTCRRIVKWWGYEATSRELSEGSDEADAVGIGDWYFRKGPGKGRKVVRRGE